MSKPLTAAAAIKRGDHFRAKAQAYKQEIVTLKRELRDARALGYAEGSGETLSAIYRRLSEVGEDGLVEWFNNLYLGRRTRKPAFHLPPEIEAIVREETEALMIRKGIYFRGHALIESLPL